MVISLFLYGRAISLLGASSGAAFGALGPAMAALIAIPALGEWPTRADWIAIMLISTGVYLAGGGPLPWPGRNRQAMGAGDRRPWRREILRGAVGLDLDPCHLLVALVKYGIHMRKRPDGGHGL